MSVATVHHFRQINSKSEDREKSMNRWILIFTIMATSLGVSQLSTRAEDVSVILPGNTKFLVQLDVRAFKKSTIGAKVFDIARKKAQDELSTNDAGKTLPDLKKIHEMLGFDPLEEVG